MLDRFFGRGLAPSVIVECEIERWLYIRELMVEINTLVKAIGFEDVEARLLEIETELEELESLDGIGFD